MANLVLLSNTKVISKMNNPSSSKIDLTKKLRFFMVKSLPVSVNLFKHVIQFYDGFIDFHNIKVFKFNKGFFNEFLTPFLY